MNVVLMASGGYDSLLIHAMKRDVIDSCVYVDYGNPGRDRELESLRRAGIEPIVLSTHTIRRDARGFYFGRNLHLIVTVREAFDDDILVYFGTTATDNFSDNSREYLYRVEGVLNDSYPAATRIECPLQGLTKSEVLALCDNAGISAYYCDAGTPGPCGKCHGCEATLSARRRLARHGKAQGRSKTLGSATDSRSSFQPHRGNL